MRAVCTQVRDATIHEMRRIGAKIRATPAPSATRIFVSWLIVRSSFESEDL
jgi:hypothetical protein